MKHTKKPSRSRDVNGEQFDRFFFRPLVLKIGAQIEEVGIRTKEVLAKLQSIENAIERSARETKREPEKRPGLFERLIKRCRRREL